MSDLFVDSFTKKLILLEQKTGARVSYRVFSSFETPITDYISVLKAAKQIANFIGLEGFTFHVAVVKQKEKVGGHIDLNTRGKDVFIEVEEATMRTPDVVGAILCHEVCHKWLQVNGIRLSLEIENEILTDITTIFLGLGRVMLNGCKSTNVRREATSGGTQTITQTMTSGYLDGHQMAFVYRLVCAMRNIPAKVYEQSLNSEGLSYVRACDKAFGHHYDSRFHRQDAIQDAVNNFCSSIVAVQRKMAELDKNLTYIKKSCCETIDGFLNGGHQKIESMRQKSFLMTEKNTQDPALNFLLSIAHKNELDRMSEEALTIRQETDSLLEKGVEKQILTY